MIKFTTYVTLFIAIALSGVAAYFSVLGLMEIFSASQQAVMIMAIVLELAKVSTAYWAHINWRILPKTLKAFFVSAVLILMAITSLGIYGFLAKAHVSQKFEITATYDTQIKAIEASINDKKQSLVEIDNQIKALDDAMKETASSSQRGFITKSYEINKKYLEDKQALLKLKDPVQEEILELEQRKISVEGEKALSETKIGPLKYVANLVYGDDASPEELNTAVRTLIIILITVFDPLAILLLIGTGYVLKYLEFPINRTPVAVKKPGMPNSRVVVFDDKFESPLQNTGTINSSMNVEPYFKTETKSDSLMERLAEITPNTYNDTTSNTYNDTPPTKKIVVTRKRTQI